MTPSADRTPPQAKARASGCDAGDAVVYARPAEHPLGPLVQIRRLERAICGRVYAAGIALAAGAVLAVAAVLSPDPSHMGTHQQLGFYSHPCGFVIVTGLPCPTCGMTTAFAHTVRGQFAEAIRSQLAGFLLAIAAAGTVLVATLAALTGRRPAINWYRVHPMRLVWWSVGLLVASWAGKIVLGLADGSLPVK